MKPEELARVVSAWTLMVLLALPALAQTTSWENLRQLNPGQKIVVVQRDRKSFTGSFAGVSNDSVSLNAREGSKTVARANVLRVSRHGGKRSRNALIGAAIGGGAGLAVGATVPGCKQNTFGFCLSKGVVAAILGGTGAVVGAIVGVLIPGNTVVYRASRQ
jgi:hypothetical protein